MYLEDIENDNKVVHVNTLMEVMSVIYVFRAYRLVPTPPYHPKQVYVYKACVFCMSLGRNGLLTVNLFHLCTTLHRKHLMYIRSIECSIAVKLNMTANNSGQCLIRH